MRALAHIALALTIGALAAPAMAGDDSDRRGDPPPEIPRGLRCRIDPFDQWCIQLGVGGTLGYGSAGWSYGLGAQVGTFPLRHLGTAIDGGFVYEPLGDDGNPATDDLLRRYDTGLTVRYYIPLGSSVLLSPGYRGGLFWYRGALVGRGTVHGPRLGLSYRVASSLYLGLQGVYEWTTFAGDRQADFWLAPYLTVAF